MTPDNSAAADSSGSARVRAAAQETFASFSNRNFRLFFAGQTISQIGNWLTLIAQALLVHKITGNGISVGLLTAFQFAPVLVLGPWAGLVADRSNKRLLLMVVQAFAMAQSFALGALAFMDHPPVEGIYAIAFVGGIAVAFDNPARRSFVVEMVDKEQINNAISLNSALMTGSRIIGPALGGLLIATIGYGWCFIADGLSYIAVLVGYALMDPSKMHPSPAATAGKGQIRAGLRYVKGVTELRVPLVMMAIVGTLTFNFTVVFTLLVKQTFRASDTAFTILFSFISVGSLVGALLAARRKESTVQQLARAAAAFGVAMLIFAATPNLATAIPIGVLVGFTSISFLTSSTTIVQLRAEPAMRGRVLALQAMVFLGSTPIGGPILGAICDWLGPRAGVVTGGVAALVAAAYGMAAATRGPDEVGLAAVDPGGS